MGKPPFLYGHCRTVCCSEGIIINGAHAACPTLCFLLCEEEVGSHGIAVLPRECVPVQLKERLVRVNTLKQMSQHSSGVKNITSVLTSSLVN